ncbi:ribonuclease P protein component [Streptococcus moroccensis]|uniref:Ribonuclease P protein component n=1 Tax=Streptococcus moroccensis TaxID=1451356 RepID=A0ABT9YS22_9STRE|nr:ribonuclease P protein component [Streptococcus moroccensis]MDQ0222793.1 ribonuclease P protein component [Streptococcus moroccensis]
MKKSYRVKREKDFSAIFKQGQNIANRKFVLYHLETEQKHFRVGLSVSKKLGNAVVRNQIKRLMRHVLITHRQQIKAEDFVLIARKGVEDLNYHEIEKNLLHVLKLANLYEEEQEEGRDFETND